jgi:hypothetical protein
MQDIENILIDAANEHKIVAPAEAWPFIADALHKRRKRKFAWVFLAFFAILCIVVSNLFLLSNKKDTKNITPHTIISTQNSSTKNTIVSNKNADDTEETQINTLLTKKENAINIKEPTKNEHKTNEVITPSPDYNIKNHKSRNVVN